jgi:hypothetical protein
MNVQQLTRDYVVARSRLDKAKIEVNSAEQCLATARDELGQAERAHARLGDVMIAIMERQVDERVSRMIDTAQTARNHAETEVEELRERLTRLECLARVARATRQPHTHGPETRQADCPRCRADHDLGVALMSLEEAAAPSGLGDAAKGRAREVPTLDLAHGDDGGNRAGG